MFLFSTEIITEVKHFIPVILIWIWMYWTVGVTNYTKFKKKKNPSFLVYLFTSFLLRIFVNPTKY